jgi:hypothetical protein
VRDNARRLGFVDLYAPLRPTEKHLEPLTPFADYVARQREDGLPYDSWIRAHVLAGARIVKVASYSMVVSGTIAEWTAWTGLAFGGSGPAFVPGALSPVHVSLEQDYGSMSSQTYGYTTASTDLTARPATGPVGGRVRALGARPQGHGDRDHRSARRRYNNTLRALASLTLRPA